MGPKEKYAKLVKTLIEDPRISQQESKKGKKTFGSSALWVSDRIFALLSSKNEFVVKLPRERVDKLVANGEGRRFAPRHDGRVMKQWVVIDSSSKLDWLNIAIEAMQFVSSAKKKSD